MDRTEMVVVEAVLMPGTILTEWLPELATHASNPEVGKDRVSEITPRCVPGAGWKATSIGLFKLEAIVV